MTVNRNKLWMVLKRWTENMPVNRNYFWTVFKSEQKMTANINKLWTVLKNEQKKCRWTETIFEQFLKWTKNDCEQKQSMNGFKKMTEKMPVNRNYFWIVFKVNKNDCEEKQIMNSLKKSEQKKCQWKECSMRWNLQAWCQMKLWLLQMKTKTSNMGTFKKWPVLRMYGHWYYFSSVQSYCSHEKKENGYTDVWTNAVPGANVVCCSINSWKKMAFANYKEVGSLPFLHQLPFWWTHKQNM